MSNPTAPTLTQDLLKSLLVYDPATGAFTWLKRPGRTAWNTRYAGKLAGYDWRIGKLTYRCIRLFDWPFMAHRLAVLYMTGQWPPQDVDHRDTDGLNNRWSNLRLATKVDNAGNTGVKKSNKTGLKGVSRSSSGRFRANISIDGRQTCLGTFATPEAAHEAYKRAALRKYAEFARFE